MSCPTPNPQEPCVDGAKTARRHDPPNPPDIPTEEIDSDAQEKLSGEKNPMRLSDPTAIPAYTGINAGRVTAEAKRIASLPSMEQPTNILILQSAIGDNGAKAAMQLARTPLGSETAIDVVQEAIAQAQRRLRENHPDIDPAIFYRDSSNSFSQSEFRREFETALGSSQGGVTILTTAALRDLAFSYARSVTCVFRELETMELAAAVSRARALGMRPTDFVRQRFNLPQDVVAQLGPAITYFDQNQEPEIAPVINAIMNSPNAVQMGRIAEKIQAFLAERRSMDWKPAVELVSPPDVASPMARKLQVTVEVLGSMVRAGQLSQAEYDLLMRMAQQAMGGASSQEMLPLFLYRTVKTLNDLPTRTKVRMDSVMPPSSLDAETYARLGVGLTDVIRAEIGRHSPAEVEQLARRVQAAVGDIEAGQYGDSDAAAKVVYGLTDDPQLVASVFSDLAQHLGDGDLSTLRALCLATRERTGASTANEPRLLARILRMLFDLR